MTAAVKTRKSGIVDNLSLRKVSDGLYEVESRSITLGSHTVRRTYSGEMVCDRFCTAYNFQYRCSHVASVLRYEREQAMALAGPPEELVFSDNCCWDAGNLPGNPACICVCHSQAVVNIEPITPKRTLESLWDEYE